MGFTVRQPTVAAVALLQSDKVRKQSGLACPKHHRGTTTEHYAGIDVSLESAIICVVAASGWIVREAKVAREPEVLIGWFGRSGAVGATLVTSEF
jgi:hypothetical protein